MKYKIRINNLSERKADLLTSLFLILLPPLFFWRETLGWFTLADKDATFWFFPIWMVAVEQVKAGQLPLWNPYLYGGTALFAQWEPALLDPLNWLQLLGPTSGSLNAAQVASFVIALFGTFGFARQVRMKRRAAVISAVIYAFSGYLIARTIYPGLLHISALMPALLWSIERTYQTGRWRSVVIGSLIIAWQLFAAHPQPFIYSSLLAASYALFCALLRRREHAVEDLAPFRFLVQCTAMFALGSALAAVNCFLPGKSVASR